MTFSNKDLLQINTGFAVDTQVGNATAAAILTNALGQTVASSQIISDSTEDSIYRFNGDSYYLGASDGDYTFEDGEVVIRFIGGYDIDQDDILLF